MPAVCSGMWEKEKCVPSSEVLEKISGLGKLEQLKFRGKGPSRNYRLKGAAGIIGVISPLSDHFCGFCNRLRLTANGKIRPCLFSKDVIDIIHPLRNGASDEEIEKLFCQAVSSKPEGHSLNKNIEATRYIKTMYKIEG